MKISNKKGCSARSAKTSKLRIGRKKGAAKINAKQKAKKKTPFDREPGYKRKRGSRLFVPDALVDGDSVQPVSKFEKGIAKAQNQIREALHTVAESLGDGIHVRHADLQISFSAEGKFLGIGAGGAATITVRVEVDTSE